MNEASRWRLEVARQIAAVYAVRPGVRMIVAGGSAAHGTADAYSDLDIVVYWDAVDGAWLEAPPLAPLGGERFTWLQADTHGSRLEQYRLGQDGSTSGRLKVDVAGLALPVWEALVADVTERFELTAAKQKALAGFLDSAVLYGAPEYARWEARIGAYPEELALAMVRAHLIVLPPWVPERMALDRGDLYGFYDLVCDAIRNVLAMLAGLNRRYHSTGPEPKWTERFVRSLAIAPPRTYERISAVLERRDHETIARFYALVDELYALVDEHLPAVDTARVRAVLHFAMEPCTGRPILENGA